MDHRKVYIKNHGKLHDFQKNNILFILSNETSRKAPNEVLFFRNRATTPSLQSIP